MLSFKHKALTFVFLSVAFLGYSTVLYFTETEEPQFANESAQRGKILWQQKNCVSCHQLYGLGGHLGPDLTNVFSTKPVEYIRAFLKSGNPVMPDFNLSDEETDALIEFFKYTNTTGNSHPKSFSKHFDGTLSQP